MPSITKLTSGNWRAQVRRKVCYVADTFRRRKDAEEWALYTERSINHGVTPQRCPKGPAKTFGDLIDLHVHDLHEVGKPIRRSKAAVMAALKLSLGRVRIEWRQAGLRRNWIEEHEDIVDALEDGDVEKAVKLVNDHMQSAAERVLQYIK